MSKKISKAMTAGIITSVATISGMTPAVANAAKQAADTAKQTADNAAKDLDNAKAANAQAQADVKAADDGMQQTITDAQNAAKAQADTDANAAQNAQDTANAAQDAESAAADAVNNAKQDVEDAKTKSDAAAEAAKDATNAAVSDAKDAYDTAATDADTANKDAKDAESAAKQTKLKLLDVDAPDKDVDDANSFIGGAKSKELASFFREAKQLVLKEYAETGDPFETYRYFNEYQIDGHHPKVVARIAAKTNRISVALGWLYESVAYFLINDGEIGYVHDARNYLIEALDVYERIPENPDLPEFTASVRKRVIQSKWLLAITYKQERNLARAHEILSDLIPYAEETRREYEVPYPDSELLPRRELAIVDDDLDEFDKLIEDEPLYSDNAREHFFTLRRCFEAYCFNYEVQRAEAIKPRLENSYKLVKEQLEPVYYYALKFDEFFYYWASGQTDRAERLYQEIYPEMSERHFTKYANTLQKAHADMLRGRHIRSDAYER